MLRAVVDVGVKRENKNYDIIIVALETIKERLDETLQLLSGQLSATELQKITLMSTAHIICKVQG
jgi:hypothetical protein